LVNLFVRKPFVLELDQDGILRHGMIGGMELSAVPKRSQKGAYKEIKAMFDLRNLLIEFKLT
jgi:hypothetical protein